jgi:membrane peptidoglycan carboxypeptidase
MARYLQVTWSPADGCFASDRLTPDQRGHVGNSDVPGPYRQDSAGDYGSAEFGIGRNAGYGRSGPGGPGRHDGSGQHGGDADYGNSASGNSDSGNSGGGNSGGRRAAGRRRRPGPDSGADATGRSSARAVPQPGRRSPQGSRGTRGYPAANASGPGQVADDLRDRLGVRGARGGRGGPDRQGNTDPRGRSRAADASTRSIRPAPDRYSEESYSGSGSGQPSRLGDTGPGYGSRAPGGRDRDGSGRGRGGGRGGGGPGGPNGLAPRQGPRQRRSFGEWFKSGDWWRRWTWKKALGVAAALMLSVPVFGLVAFFIAYEQTPVPTETSALATAAPSTVYFLNDKPIGTFSSGGLNRQILTAGQIPAVMNNAIIAAEDRQFYSEGGISITGILRAAYSDLKGGNVNQGGSTLTEQFVKNYYTGFASADNSDKSANDKLKQALVAIKLAHIKSKSWILTQYLNTVYLGENSYGVGAAAQVYFGEPASKLTVSQAAMLAALANLPGYFSTDPSAGAAYTGLQARWQYVLKNMVRDGALTPAQASAQKFPVVHLHFSPSLNGYKGYLMQMVQQELSSTYHLTQAQIDTGGLKIYTSFSQEKMFELNQSVNAAKLAMAQDGQGLPAYAYIGAVLENPSTGAIEAIYGGPGYGVKNCAHVRCYLNMAEDPKQVGSSFKPYVLSAAVLQGMDVQSSVLNGYSPLWIPESQTAAGRRETSSRTPKSGGYLPFNEPSEKTGPISAQKAAAISSDPAFEDLTHRVGVQNLLGVVKKFGIGQNPFNSTANNDLTELYKQFGQNSHASTAGSVAISLGEGELTAVEQASLFATLANGGLYHTPHVISRIITPTGELPLKVVTRPVLSTVQAADVDFALSADNVPGGTAYPQAAWPGHAVIGKTGTTQTAQDAWFIGAIPQQSMAVALFTDSQNSISGPGQQTLDMLPRLAGNSTGGYGGAWPAYIWHSYMTSTFGSLPPAAFGTPDYTGFDLWNQVTGTALPMPAKAKPTPTPSAPDSFPTQPEPSSSVCDTTGMSGPCPPQNGGFSPPPSPPAQPTPQPSQGGPGSPPPTQ